jgi:nitrite reductase/ring-hydroxylating ferredoxin subunit
VLGYAGLALVSGGGYLGGHLSYAMAAGANHAEDVPHLVPSGWSPIAPLDDVPERTLHQRYLGDVSVLLYRRGDRVSALSAKCSHLSGPLAEGTLLERGDDPCVVCPWHGSVFEIETGEVVHGPATAPQHRFTTRVVDGMIEVSLPG